jgi:RNA-directed DNA polymerase
LQIKILEAYKSGDKNQVERYQLILINSFGARALAIKKVTTNLGQRTPGIDKNLYQNNEDKINAIHALHNAKPALYKASPVKRVVIPKPNQPNRYWAKPNRYWAKPNRYFSKPTRYLAIPTLYDRAVQVLYAFALEPIALYTSDPNSFFAYEGIGT